ncbi:MAG: PEP-CTERM sorting domain-containing protein [Planctomycetia bacterium]|nr:PEP-CTERM sorting domain-containing protein [Planctomycetia bacterium]
MGIILTTSTLTAATIWNGGTTPVTDLKSANTWSNGTPSWENTAIINDGSIVTLTTNEMNHLSLEVSNGTLATSISPWMPVSESGSRVSITLSDTGKLTTSGHFYPMGQCNPGSKTPVWFALTMTDHAEMMVKGTIYGGFNRENATVPLPGNEYTGSLIFRDNAKLTATGEGWLATTAKMYILVEDNAALTFQSGNSGIGWGDGAEGSLLEMRGGSITQSGTGRFSVTLSTSMKQSGGTFTVPNFTLDGNSTTELSGTAIAKVSTLSNISGHLNIRGGSWTTTNLSGSGSISMTANENGFGKFTATGNVSGYTGTFHIGLNHGLGTFANDTADGYDVTDFTQAPTVTFSEVFHYDPADGVITLNADAQIAEYALGSGTLTLEEAARCGWIRLTEETGEAYYLTLTLDHAVTEDFLDWLSDGNENVTVSGLGNVLSLAYKAGAGDIFLWDFTPYAATAYGVTAFTGSVPEPATWVLLVVGIGFGIGIRSWRKDE